MALERLEVADRLRNAVFENLDFFRLQIAHNLRLLVARDYIDENLCRACSDRGSLGIRQTASKLRRTP